MIILIPAYEAVPALPQLVSALRSAAPDIVIVVVDDGSGPLFEPVFAGAERAGATVLRHPVNRGKGAALKIGIAHALRMHPGVDVITADADGQHTVRDILRIADALREDSMRGDPPVVLGCRAFTGDVPWRSRVGNHMARAMFRRAAGWSLSDTQTGLRGIPAEALPWMLAQPGDRFEYEQNVLLRCRRDGIATREVSIDTVYLEGNATSHFRPIVDSLRVALPLLLFAGSSLIAFAVDTIALLLFAALSGALVPSIVAARVLSATVNFAMNRRYVFGASTRRRRGQALRYALLAAALLASNIVWIEALTSFGLPLLAAKVITEVVLFVTSYGVQKTFVFGASESVSAAQATHSNRIATAIRMDADQGPTRRSS